MPSSTTTLSSRRQWPGGIPGQRWSLFPAEMVTRVQDSIPASRTHPPGEAAMGASQLRSAEHEVSWIEIVSYFRTRPERLRCDG